MKVFSSLPEDVQIIVVDDGSPDGTLAQAQAMQREYGSQAVCLRPRSGKLGLGSAYLHGAQAARGEYIIIMDADMSHHPKFIPAMLQAVRAGADVVTGSRYTGVAGYGVAGWDLKRKVTSQGANILASLLLQPSVSDLTGSFRLYTRAAFDALVPRIRSRGYVFQMEIIVRAEHELGLKIAEVPITFVDRVYGESKLGGAEIVGYLKGLLTLFVEL